MFKEMLKGKESKKLMLIGALCLILMIGAISAYLIISSRQHLKSQAEKMSASLEETIARNLDTSFDNITNFFKETPSAPVSIEGADILKEVKRVISFYTGSAFFVYNCDYAVELERGQIYVGFARDGLKLEDFPLEMFANREADTLEGRYEIVDSFGGREGTFIIVERAIRVSTMGREMTLTLIINATDQVNALSVAYNADKKSIVGKQVLFSIIIFLGLLFLSILVIYFAIKRSLSDPIDAINESARSIASGESSEDIEPDEKSIFYHLQMLLRSGQVIFRKDRADERRGERVEMKGGRKGHEVRMVLVVWVALFLIISAVSVAVLVYSSIYLLNGKTEALKEDVARQTGDYYKNALDSTIDFIYSNPPVTIGQELWDPDPNATINREQTVERMLMLMKTSFNAEYMAYINNQKVKASTEAGNVLPGLPETYTDGYRILHDLKRDGDTYISLCKKTDYPFVGPEDQYVYTLVDITEQTDAITVLYQDSRSQLLWSQLIIALMLLVLSIILAPLVVAWAVRKYVSAPILELDELSKQIMEGTLEKDVAVDETSSFGNIQRLLARAQELLRSI